MLCAEIERPKLGGQVTQAHRQTLAARFCDPQTSHDIRSSVMLLVCEL